MTSNPPTSSGRAPAAQGTGGVASSPCVAGQPASRSDIDPLLPIAQVVEMTGMSKPTIWRWVRKGTFPQPYRLGGKSVRWPRSEVQAVIDRARPVEG